MKALFSEKEEAEREVMSILEFDMEVRIFKPARHALKQVLAAVTVLAVIMAVTGSAHADFRVCNATSTLVGVSIGYRTEAGWVTEGWWHIEKSKCKTIIEGPLSSRYYYIYAEDAERGSRWEGPILMCIAEKEFKIIGTSNCFQRGFQRSGFQEYDTGEQDSWMVQLTDEPKVQEPAPIGEATSQ